VADAEPLAFVAVTTASIVAPTSLAVSLYDDLAAPAMVLQLPASQICQRYV